MGVGGIEDNSVIIFFYFSMKTDLNIELCVL